MNILVDCGDPWNGDEILQRLSEFGIQKEGVSLEAFPLIAEQKFNKLSLICMNYLSLFSKIRRYFYTNLFFFRISESFICWGISVHGLCLASECFEWFLLQKFEYWY